MTPNIDTTAPDVEERVVRKIQAWRDALIDLSKRNPLLSLPRTVLPIRSLPDDLWKLPPTGKRGAFQFKPAPLPDPAAVETETPAPPAPRAKEQFVTEEEARRLNTLRLKANLSLAEQGINVLFVTLGTLEWRDPKIGELLRSPLLLLPVTLVRLPANGGFQLSRFEDDATVNPTLRYRLSQSDIGFTLPEPDEEDITPSVFLRELAGRIAEKSGWSVILDECLLGRFSYLRLAMYDDLTRQFDRAKTHFLVRALAGDTESLSGLPSVSAPALTELDLVPPQNTHYVLQTDPSQEQAIIAARMGQSFVLQGPPGTGKTQTIANLIASCIADGRRVLFVSEKMAALDAVFKRLREAKLGDFCLEAHSHKANKKEILEQLRAALAVQDRGAEPQIAFPQLVSLREQLNNFVAALHAPRTPLEKSVYAARGILTALRDAPELPFVLASPELLTSEELLHCETLATRLAGYHDLFPLAETHPWHALKPETRFSAELQARLRAVLDDLLRESDRALSAINRLRALCGLPVLDEDRIAPEDAARVVAIASLLETTPRPLAAWLESPEAEVAELQKRAVATQAAYQHYRERYASLMERWEVGVFDVPHSELAHRLLEKYEEALRPPLGRKWSVKAGDLFIPLVEALNAVDEATERLQRGAARLAQLCGLTAPGTGSAARFLGDVVRLVLNDLKPEPIWFDAGNLPQLTEFAKSVSAHFAKVAQADAALNPVYGPNLQNLDLNTLIGRFTHDYANILRYLNPGYYQDRKTIAATLQPGASLDNRNIATDLALARDRRNATQWIADNTAALTRGFGRHYRGAATDWQGLEQALRHTDSLTLLLQGTIPDVLQQRILASGPELAVLRDQLPLFETQVREYEESLARLSDSFTLPDDGVIPANQLAFDRLQDWCVTLRRALADIHMAREETRPARRTWPASSQSIADDLREAEALITEERRIRGESDDLKARFSHFFSGMDTDWEAARSALAWTSQFRNSFATAREPITAEAIAIATTGNPDVRATIARTRAEVEGQIQRFSAPLPHHPSLSGGYAAGGGTQRVPGGGGQSIYHEIRDLFRPEALRSKDGASSLEQATFAEQQEFAEDRLAVMGELERWLSFQQLRLECADAGMLSFYEVTTRRNVPADSVLRAFQRGFYDRWLDAVLSKVPELQSFRGDIHDSHRARFVQLEQSLLKSNPRRIRQKTKDRRELTGTSNLGEVAALKRFLNQKRPRASVRKILAEIPNLLFRLTPCLLMSPLSVSLFLDSERLWFDVVIFDEASQVLVESSLGALLRASQAIIAGDTRQLPPTSFFKGLQDEETEEEDALAPSSAHEFESILSAASAVAPENSPYFPERALTWHYRSQHESLIAFSRQHFYHRLDTFPSSGRPSALEFVHVSDGIYYGGSGRARNNPVEAARVVYLAIEQLTAEPNLSVGIITMSESQQNAILAELDRIRATADAPLLELLSEDPTPNQPEPLFVKNIENVQGDERDIIFLSIGYGRYPDGTLYQRFGPINTEGGEKRLNVAVTRARQRCITVSSLQPEDVAIRDTTRIGPRLLRQYMESARLASPMDTGIASDEDRDLLAEAVALALEQRGYTVHRSVGLFDYRIDLAVMDPKDSNRYLLGIECDGPNYISAPTAHAREALRAEVLHRLGWHLYRVWSADWVRDSAVVVAGITTALERAQSGEQVSSLPKPATHEEEHAADTPPLVTDATTLGTTGGLLPGLTYYTPPGASPPFRDGTQTLYGDSLEDREARCRLVEALVLYARPMPSDTIAPTLARAANLNRAGQRIQTIAEATIATLVQQQRITRQSERWGDQDITILWPAHLTTAPARIPQPGDTPRPIEQISQAEIEQVILCLLRSAIGMRRDEAITETARLLGYNHTGTNLRDRIVAALDSLEFDHHIHVRGGQVYTFEE